MINSIGYGSVKIEKVKVDENDWGEFRKVERRQKQQVSLYLSDTYINSNHYFCIYYFKVISIWFFTNEWLN